MSMSNNMLIDRMIDFEGKSIIQVRREIENNWTCSQEDKELALHYLMHRGPSKYKGIAFSNLSEDEQKHIAKCIEEIKKKEPYLSPGKIRRRLKTKYKINIDIRG